MADVESLIGVHLYGDKARKLSLSKDKLVEVGADLMGEVSSALSSSERQALVKDWDDIEKKYEGGEDALDNTVNVEHYTKVFVPLTAANVDSIYTRERNALIQGDPFWTIKVLDGDDDLNKGLEQLLHRGVARSSWFLGALDNVLQSCAELGTGIFKVHYTQDWYPQLVKKKGKLTQRFKKVSEGVRVRAVPPQDFVLSESSHDVGHAKLVGERTVASWGKLKLWKDKGVIYDLEGLDEKDAPFTLWNLHAFYDVTESGYENDIFVLIEERTKKILRIQTNGFDMYRPYTMTPYFPRKFSEWGKGIGKMSKDLNAEVNAIHNVTLTSAIQSLLMAYKRSGGFAPSNKDGEEKIVPFTIYNLEPGQDIQPFPLGTSNVISGLAIQQDIERILSRYTGATDVIQGMGDKTQGSRATVGGTAILERLASSKLDLPLNMIRERGLDPLGRLILKMYMQFGPGNAINYVDAKYRTRVLQFLDIGVDVDENINVSVTATTADQSREAKKMRYIEASQPVTAYLTEKLGLLNGYIQAQSPSLREGIKRIAEGADYAMLELLDAMQIKPDKIVQSFDDLFEEVQNEGLAMGMGATGAQQSIPGNQGAPGEVGSALSPPSGDNGRGGPLLLSGGVEGAPTY